MNVEPVIMLYVWGLITDAKMAEFLDVPLHALPLIVDGLKEKADLFRVLADGPAVPHYRKVLDDWSFSQGNQQHP